MDNFKRIAFAFLATAIFTSFNDVTAQEVEVEEVVVTATRREESLQDVALSAQALTSEDLDAAQVTEMYDLGELTPGISFAPAIGSGYFIAVRGAATEAIGASSTAATQTAINGHVVTASAFGDIGFMDAERVEILAGPQGTLYGRNVTGGQINLITARPTGDSSGYVKMDYGNLGQTRIRSAINIPMASNVAARVAYSSYIQDGTIKNLNLGTEIDNRDAESFRMSLDVDVDASNTIQITHEEHEFEDSRLNWASRFCNREVFLGCDPTVRGAYNTGAHPAGTLAGGFAVLTFLSPDKLYDSNAGALASDDLNEIYLDLDPSRSQLLKFSTIEWINARENGDLKVKASYSVRDYNHIDDNDKGISGQTAFSNALSGLLGTFTADLEYDCWGTNTRGAPTNVECSSADEDTTQLEANWISDNDGPLNYTLGAYRYESKYANDYQVQTEGYVMNGDFRMHPYSQTLFGGQLDGYGGVSFWGTLGALVTAGLPGYLGGQITLDQLVGSIVGNINFLNANGLTLTPDGPVPNAFGPGYMQSILPDELRGLINSEHGNQQSTSLFGEVYYELNDTTKLTVGLRYDDNSNYFMLLNTLGDATTAGAIAAACSRAAGGAFIRSTDCGYADGTQSNTATTGKLAIQKSLSDDVMVYGLVSTANKPGGNSPNESGDVLPYAPTDGTNIEFGLRSTLAGGRVLLNATLFQHTQDDGHNSMIYGTSAITNTIDYTHTGLEIQSRYLLGENTSLDINVFALDSEIGDENLYDPANPFGLSSGTPLALFTDEDGLGLFFANALGSLPAGQATASALYAGLADAGVLTPFCNWGLFTEGLVAKCQGVFVVNPAIIGNPGFAQVVRQDLNGNRMPFTRELDYNISLNQAFTTANGVVDSRLTMAHKGDAYMSLFNTERASVPEQRYFDLITTYRPNNGDWYVGVYGKNLADKRHLIGIDRGSEVEGSVLNATIGFPRTYGVSFGIDF
jgi:outer membrane receptor protein involved in Fe transport